VPDENTLVLKFVDDTPPEKGGPSSPYPSQSDQFTSTPAAPRQPLPAGGIAPAPSSIKRHNPDLDAFFAGLDAPAPAATPAQSNIRPDMAAGMASSVFNRLPPDAMTKGLTDWLKKQEPPRAKPAAEVLETDQDRQSRQLRGLLLAANFGMQGGKTAQGLASGGLALAETGMLGKGAAAIAGGPMGLVAMLAAAGVDLAADKIANRFRAQRDLIETGGKVAQGVVADRPLQVFTAATDHAAKSLEEIPVVGKIFAEELRRDAAVVRVFSETLDAVTARARQLAPYDARIAAAAANQDVANLLRDMKEARTIGGEYSELIRQQTQLEGSFREMMLPIKELIAKGLNDVMADLNVLARDLVPLVTEAVHFLSVSYDVAKEGWGVLVEAAKLSPALGILIDQAQKHFKEVRDREAKRAIGEGQQAAQLLLDQARKQFRVGAAVGVDNAPRDKLQLQLPLGIQFNIPVGGQP
jgi:hypothetical protein